MTTWTAPNGSRYTPLTPVGAADLNNLEGNFAHIAAGGALYASQSASVTLTGSVQDVTGASISLTAGKWLIFGSLILYQDSAGGDNNQELYGQLWVDGVQQSNALFAKATHTGYANPSQTWLYTATSTVTAKLRALKNGGTGASAAIVGSDWRGWIAAVRYSPSTS